MRRLKRECLAEVGKQEEIDNRTNDGRNGRGRMGNVKKGQLEYGKREEKEKK